MKKHYSFVLVLALVNLTQLAAFVPSRHVFKESLDEFITRMTSEIKDQEGFRAYYSGFLDRQSRMSLYRRQKRLRRLRME